MEECSDRQDEIDGPDSEDDQNHCVRSKSRYALLDFALPLIFETYSSL